MSSAIEYAQLVSRLVSLTAIPADKRLSSPENTAAAVKALAEFKAYAMDNMGATAIAGYAKRCGVVANWLNAPSPEPWVAFVAGGPDKAPPAVALLQPAPSEPGLSSAIWDVLVAYTGPGMLYTYLVEGKVPTNGLMAAIEGAMGATADKVSQVAGDLWKPVLGVAAVVGVFLLWRRK